MNTDGNENELVIANNYVTDEQIRREKWNVITDVPAIFFAKVGAAVMLNRKRLVRFPFLLDNNTMAYIFDKEVWDSDFGKTLFETVDLSKLTQIGALPSYNSSDVEDVEISIPSKPEQEHIGSFFQQLDNLITPHQRKRFSCYIHLLMKIGTEVSTLHFHSLISRCLCFFRCWLIPVIISSAVHVFFENDGTDSAGADSAGAVTITGETSTENR